MSSPKTMKLELHADFPYQEASEHSGLFCITRNVGYAVKGTPFKVTLRVVSKSKISLSHAQVQLQLLVEETYAPVEIGERPIKWEASPSGSSQIVCETRILVLSTQLAKSCVVIKATVTLEGQKPLEALSCPIKVVSKPEQIRRKRKEANQEPELEGSKKRARSEDVLVKLRSLYDQSKETLEEMRRRHDSEDVSADAFYDDDDEGSISSIREGNDDTDRLQDDQEDSLTYSEEETMNEETNTTTTTEEVIAAATIAASVGVGIDDSSSVHETMSDDANASIYRSKKRGRVSDDDDVFDDFDDEQHSVATSHNQHIIHSSTSTTANSSSKRSCPLLSLSSPIVDSFEKVLTSFNQLVSTSPTTLSNRQLVDLCREHGVSLAQLKSAINIIGLPTNGKVDLIQREYP